MSSVLDRSALEQSPLADLHLLANELGVDGFRRLRKADLIDAILARQAGDDRRRAAEGGDAGERADEAEAAPDGRSRTPARRGGAHAAAAAAAAADADDDAATDEPRRRADAGRPRRARRPRARTDKPRREERREVVEGVVELLGNGSGFVRLSPPEPTDDDVYVSAAQVKRCELVSGDRVAGPVRPPRRSERFPSLVRVDTINGRPADEVAEGTRFEDLPVAFPAERFELGSEDPTVKAIEWLTPFGKGSRVVDRRRRRAPARARRCAGSPARCRRARASR